MGRELAPCEKAATKKKGFEALRGIFNSND
jgi:hypothetical protein